MRFSRASRAVVAATTVLGLLYPFLVLIGLRYLPPIALAALLAALIGTRWLLGRRGPTELILVAAATLVVALQAIAPKTAVQLYPVLVSLGFAALFASTFWHPPVMVERFARLHRPNLPETARPYLRGWTMAWVGFFLLNAAIAAWTVAFGTVEQWTLYNGLISYVMIGAMFAGELATRRVVRP
jgi:uncharacterized membrane protein